MRKFLITLIVGAFLVIPTSANAHVDYNKREYWYYDNWMVNTGFYNLNCHDILPIYSNTTQYVATDLLSTAQFRRFEIAEWGPTTEHQHAMWAIGGGPTTRQYLGPLGSQVSTRHLTVYNALFPNGVRVTKVVRGAGDSNYIVLLRGPC